MQNSIHVIQELIELFRDYSDANPKSKADLRSFVLWLNSQLFDQENSTEKKGAGESPDMELSLLLVLQHKHFKSYSKIALEKSILSSPDDFSFLYHLSLVESYRKMELVKIHLLEAPSGIEVLKRLLRKVLIEEFDDPDDKRARRIKITEKGRNELNKTAPEMQKVFEKMSTSLSRNQKLTLLSFLRIMHEAHSEEIPNH